MKAVLDLSRSPCSIVYSIAVVIADIVVIQMFSTPFHEYRRLCMVSEVSIDLCDTAVKTLFVAWPDWTGNMTWRCRLYSSSSSLIFAIISRDQIFALYHAVSEARHSHKDKHCGGGQGDASARKKCPRIQPSFRSRPVKQMQSCIVLYQAWHASQNDHRRETGWHIGNAK